LDEEARTSLAERLEVIAEELSDLGQACLTEALSLSRDDDKAGAARAAAQERRLAAARRAVLKAVAALRERPGE
jgi:hypothetical protein